VTTRVIEKYHGEQLGGKDRSIRQPRCWKDLSRPPLRQERLHTAGNTVYDRRIVFDKASGGHRLVYGCSATDMGHSRARKVQVYLQVVLQRYVCTHWCYADKHRDRILSLVLALLSYPFSHNKVPLRCLACYRSVLGCYCPKSTLVWATKLRAE
jgi:hypothetical protein